VIDLEKMEDETYYEDYCNNCGIFYYECGEYEKAIQNFTKIIDLNTDDDGNLICLVRSGVALAYEHRANCYRELGKFEKSIADYSESVKLMSDNLTAYNSRGEIYEMLGELEKAVADYNAAIKTDAYDYHESSDFLYNRGRAYYLLKKYDEAASDFIEAIEFDYSHNTNKAEQAILLLTEVIKFNPNYAEAYDSRGEYYKELGETDKADADFKKAEELWHNDDNPQT